MRLGEAFEALMHASLDNDDFHDGNDDDVIEQWPRARDRVRDEFSPQRGGLARMMYGATNPSTRRRIQAAFNRHHSYPQVLVAQSVVGREGLNLHEACRVVMMLHPEWNPGVVEQQIGRVDRLGSRWKRELAHARHTDTELPCIEVLSVVFEGTYDEHNWRVLRHRWASLEAQLHGIVVPTRGIEDADELALARSINDAAPDFGP